MTDLVRIVARLTGDIARIGEQIARARRPGVIAEYDPKRHMARARIGGDESAPFLTPWARIEEASGAQTSRTTLTVGQTVWVNCPDGDIRGCTISPGAFSKQYKSSSSEAEETRFERGGVRVAIRPDGAEMSYGDTTVTIKDSHVKIHTTGTASFD